MQSDQSQPTPSALTIEAAGYLDELLRIVRNTPAEDMNVLSWLRILKLAREEMEMTARYRAHDEEMRRILERNTTARLMGAANAG